MLFHVPQHDRATGTEVVATNFELGSKILNVWCEYVLYINTHIVSVQGVSTVESMGAISDVANELSEFAAVVGAEVNVFQHSNVLPNKNMSSASLKLEGLATELRTLVTCHSAASVAKIMQLEVKLPPFVSSNATSVQCYVVQQISATTTLLSAAVEPWQGNLLPDAMYCSVGRQIQSIVTSFASNLNNEHVHRATLERVTMSKVVKTRLRSLNCVLTRVLQKIQLKLFAMKSTVRSEALMSSSKSVVVLKPLVTVAASIKTVLTYLPGTAPRARTEDVELLQIVESIEQEKALDIID